MQKGENQNRSHLCKLRQKMTHTKVKTKQFYQKSEVSTKKATQNGCEQKSKRNNCCKRRSNFERPRDSNICKTHRDGKCETRTNKQHLQKVKRNSKGLSRYNKQHLQNVQELHIVKPTIATCARIAICEGQHKNQFSKMRKT